MPKIAKFATNYGIVIMYSGVIKFACGLVITHEDFDLPAF